jgi:hypothetical protein
MGKLPPLLRPLGAKEYPIPPALTFALRRRKRRCLIIMFLAIFVGLSSDVTWLPEWFKWLAPTFSVLLIVAAVLSFLLHNRSYYQMLLLHNFEICLSCGYPLKGLPAHHTCPECGEGFRIEDVRYTWKDALRWCRGAE